MSQPSHHDSHSPAIKGALLGIIIYLFIATIKITASFIYHSPSLRADGLNNLSDIISSTAVLVGLLIARKPADQNHRFGHERYEIIASFIVSIIMFILGFEVISDGITRLIRQDFTKINLNVIGISLFTALILFIAYMIIQTIAKKTDSIGLKATSKDMRNDLLITFTPIIGALANYWGILQLDILISIGVGLIILHSAYEIFSESSFVLADGFDEDRLEQYRQTILSHPEVLSVRNIRARIAGSGIYVDVVITVDGNTSVSHAHKITDDIELTLEEKHHVLDTDVHVEPEDELVLYPK